MRNSREVLVALNEALSTPTPYRELELSRKRSIDQMVKLWAKGAGKNLQYISSKAAEWKDTGISPTDIADEIKECLVCPITDKKILSGINEIKERFLVEASEVERIAEEDCIQQADALSACTGRQFYVVEAFDKYRTYDIVDETGLKRRNLISSDDEVVYISE